MLQPCKFLFSEASSGRQVPRKPTVPRPVDRRHRRQLIARDTHPPGAMLSTQDMADGYASESDDEGERCDSLTLPAPWQPAAATRWQHREDSCSTPRDLRQAAVAARRRPDSPPWGSSRQGLGR